MLELRNVTHIFPNKTIAINKINLTINKGEFILIAGSNGSGKTVLIRHFNGLLHPTSGEVLFENEPIKKNLLKIRRKIGLVFQDADSQIIGQTVYDDIAFGPENLKFDRNTVDKLVKNSINSVGLNGFENRCPTELSGGEKRRLIIASILVMQPEIIVFDEPFNGLDFSGVRQVLEQIVKLHELGHTIVIITHDFEKTFAYVNRLIIMQKGEIKLDMPIDINANDIPKEISKYDIKIPQGIKSKMSWLI